MAAIAEAAAIAKPVLDNNSVGLVIHEGSGQPPAALIEIACGAGIMPGIGHVSAMRQAADIPGFIPGRDKVGDQRLEAAREMAGDRDWPCGGLHADHAAAPPFGEAVLVSLPLLRVPAPQRSGRCARMGTVSGMLLMMVMMMCVVLMMLSMMMPVRCLRRDGSGQKDGGRYE